MTPDETVALTRYVAALCPAQRFDEFTADAWWDVLARYTLDEARAAAAAVAGRQPFVSAGEIATEARRARADRIGRDAETEAPPIDPNRAIDYARMLRGRRDGVATGRIPRRELETTVTRDDIAAMQQQGDLKAFMVEGMRAAAGENKRRRALVARHPDLWEQVTALPGQREWSGYIAAAEFGGKANDSPVRVALLAIVEEAERRSVRG